MRQLIEIWRTFRANRATLNDAFDELDRLRREHYAAVVAKHGRLETVRMWWRGTYPVADSPEYPAVQARANEVYASTPRWQRF